MMAGTVSAGWRRKALISAARRWSGELFIAFVMLINRGGYSVAERCVQQVQGKVWLSDLWKTFRREALNAD
jgi:hypothetical protein